MRNVGGCFLLVAIVAVGGWFLGKDALRRSQSASTSVADWESSVSEWRRTSSAAVAEIHADAKRLEDAIKDRHLKRMHDLLEDMTDMRDTQANAVQRAHDSLYEEYRSVVRDGWLPEKVKAAIEKALRTGTFRDIYEAKAAVFVMRIQLTPEGAIEQPPSPR